MVFTAQRYASAVGYIIYEGRRQHIRYKLMLSPCVLSVCLSISHVPVLY